MTRTTDRSTDTHSSLVATLIAFDPQPSILLDSTSFHLRDTLYGTSPPPDSGVLVNVNKRKQLHDLQRFTVHLEPSPLHARIPLRKYDHAEGAQAIESSLWDRKTSEKKKNDGNRTLRSNTYSTALTDYGCSIPHKTEEQHETDLECKMTNTADTSKTDRDPKYRRQRD